MNDNNELTKTEKIIISLLVVFGLSALYAVFAYIVMFIFFFFFGAPNMMIAQFVPMFVLCMFSINDIIKLEDNNKHE